MNPSLHPLAGARHGKAAAPAATLVDLAPIGLDVNDAAYHLAHDYPGGVPALAQRMGMSQHTLAHKVSLTTGTHHLSPSELVKLQAIAVDARPLQAMAAQLGYVALPILPELGGSSLEDVTRVVREFSELLGAATETMADGRVSMNELQRVEREAGETMLAIHTLLVHMRSMVPPAPECAG